MKRLWKPDPRLRIETAWREVLDALGYDLNAPHFEETPARVARFFTEWHANASGPPTITTFPNTGYDEMLLQKDVAFYSMCAHHGVPFFGHAAIAYLPSAKGRIVGLSKLARVLDHFAHRFTTQEDITCEVADFLEEALKPQGVAVVLQAEHLCMSMRGVQRPGHATVTSAMRGAFRKNAAARAEFFALTRQS
jgi:GTP cyclohydrolase I